MSNFDPNPEASEVKETVRQRVVTQDGHQHVVTETQVDKMYPDYSDWLSKDDSLPKPTKLHMKKPKHVNYKCHAKGLGEIACEGISCVAHVMTRQDYAISHKEENKILICKAHEVWFNRQDSRVWYRWVRERFPEKFATIKRRVKFIMAEYNKFMDVVREDNPAFENRIRVISNLVACTCSCHKREAIYCIKCREYHGK